MIGYGEGIEQQSGDLRRKSAEQKRMGKVMRIKARDKMSIAAVRH